MLVFLHKLAGSAGMYDYNQISEQCIKLQNAIKETNSLKKNQPEFQQLKALIVQSMDS